MKLIILLILSILTLGCSKSEPQPVPYIEIPPVENPVIVEEPSPTPPVIDEVPDPIIDDFITIISWVAPTERECLTEEYCVPESLSLSEIHGYNVRWGEVEGVYPEENKHFTQEWTYMLIGYGFAVVTCIDTEGRESKNSTTIRFE